MDYTKLASDESIEKVRGILVGRNINSVVVSNRDEALAKLKEMIPPGADLHTASSTTLNEIGFTDYLKSGSHPWKNRKDVILAQKDPAEQGELRRQAFLADYFIGSVHAIAETGEVFDASNSGSQIPGYAASSPHVIWVVSTSKIVPDFTSAMDRLKKHVVPLEDERMKKVGYPGTTLNKLLITYGDYLPDRIHIIFVKEKLGF